MKQSKIVCIGAIILIIGIVAFLAIELAVAMAWEMEPYNYFFNKISDLGAPDVGMIKNRFVNSPLHTVFNIACMVLGVVFIFGFYCMNNYIKGPHKALSMIFLAIAGIGLTMIGVFPTSDHQGFTLHILFAGFAILGGSLAMITFGLSQMKVQMRKTGLCCVIFGVLNFVWTVLAKLSLNVGGMFERFAVYTIFAFGLVFSIFVLILYKKDTLLTKNSVPNTPTDSLTSPVE